MLDPRQAYAAARSIAEATLGRPVEPLDRAPSRSHHVFLGPTVVVKVIDAADHARLDREVALATDLPGGLSAPVLASGSFPTDDGDVRYVCLARLPGTAPGMGLPGVDRGTAVHWAEQAVSQLQRLHDWTPSAPAAAVLREELDHGGFVNRAALQHRIAWIRDLDHAAIVPPAILDGLAMIADRAPDRSEVVVPVHADCHWDNWLVEGQNVTALLDFEWARFGEPADDWMFVARFTGPHLPAVLGVIAGATSAPLDPLRAACEVREAAHVSHDLRLALERPDGRGADEAASLVPVLHELVVDRVWWHTP